MTTVKLHGQKVVIHSNRRGIVFRQGYGLSDSYGKLYKRDIGTGTIRRAQPKPA